MNKIALAFLAHPDDAEILCAGTLIRLADAGWEVHIATATAGDMGSMTETPWKISAIRTEEGKNAASLINATYHCLGEQDTMVMYDKPTLRKTPVSQNRADAGADARGKGLHARPRDGQPARAQRQLHLRCAQRCDVPRA